MINIKWHIEEWAIIDLIELDINPRTISKSDAENLKVSINKFGLIDKPVVNTDGTIIGGHQRIALLKNVKAKTVECWTPNRKLLKQEIEELNIRMNRNRGDWDWDKLGNNFNVEDLINWGFDSLELGFDKAPEMLDENENKPKKSKTCPHCGKEI